MAIWNSILYRLGMDTSAWTGGTAKATKDLAALEKATKSASSSIKGHLANGIDLKGIAQGLQFEMLNKIGGGFAKLSEGAAKAADEVRKGNLTFREALGEFLRGTPVLGAFVKGWDALGEAVTGARAEMEKDLAISKASEAAFANRTKYIQEAKTKVMEWREEVTKLRQEWEKLVAPKLGKGVVEADQNRTNVLRDLRKKYEQDSKLTNSDGTPGDFTLKAGELEKAVKKRKEIGEQLRKAQVDASQTSPFEVGGTTSEPHARLARLQDEFDAQARLVQNLQTEYGGLREAAKSVWEEYTKARDQAFQTEARNAHRKDDGLSLAG